MELVVLHLTSSFIQFYPTSAPIQYISCTAGTWGSLWGWGHWCMSPLQDLPLKGHLQKPLQSLRVPLTGEVLWSALKNSWVGLEVYLALIKQDDAEPSRCSWDWPKDIASPVVHWIHRHVHEHTNLLPCLPPSLFFSLLWFLLLQARPRWHQCCRIITWQSNLWCHRGVLRHRGDMSIERAKRKEWFLPLVLIRNTRSGKAPIHSGPTQPHVLCFLERQRESSVFGFQLPCILYFFRVAVYG